MPRICLTHDPATREAWYGARALEALGELGDLVLRDDAAPLSEAALAELARDCDIIVSDRLAPAGETLFTATPSLRAFVRCAMDIRSIDVAAASRHGVLVTRAGPGFVQAVAEWILAQMINLARGLPDYALSYRREEFPEAHMGCQLAGRTAGLLGFGNIARHLAPVLKALGMRVLAHDPWTQVPADQAEAVDLAALLERSDVTICLVAYSDATERLMNAGAFARMPRGAYFINAARGGVVDDTALLAALESSHLAGAALDVGRGPDNTPTPELARHPRVLASPHVGGMVPEAVEFQAMQTVRQVAEILAGRLPEGAVNPEVAEGLGLTLGGEETPS